MEKITEYLTRCEVGEGQVRAWEEDIMLPTYGIGKEEKNPIFLEKRVYQGSCGSVYPYPVVEKIEDVKSEKKYKALFLENEYIKMMVLPELGGRVQMAYDKIKKRHFVYYNQVIKPALVGLTGPWISGGIEFNWPQHHRPSTFLPTDYSIEENPDGSKTIWCNEVERMFRTKGMHGFTLYPGKAYIEIKDGKITVTLTDTHTLTTSNQTTVTVLDKENKGVANVSVTVTDKNKATATKSTDANGKVTLPVKSSGGGSSSGGGGGRGGSSGGSYISSNITNITVTDKNGKNVSVSKSTDKDGKITLTLPNGADLTGDNYYTIKATDSKGNAKADVSIILKDKKNNSANGTTDKNGMLILPASEHKAYIFGYNDGTFRPDNNMSRAEAAAIFARLISEQKGEKISGKSNFNDVSKNEWYFDYIGYLSKYGIIKGYSNSTFRPDDNVSRAEFVAMTVRFNSLFNEVKKDSYTVKYTDVATNYWAYSDVAYAKHAGWLNGYADGSFKGDNAITRAEVVTVVNRATGRKADESYITKNVSVLNKFTDIRNNAMWYYADVMEAANTHLANSSNDIETWVK